MTDSAIIRWEEPPSRGRGSWAQEVADQLRRNPGRWAIIREGETHKLNTYATNVRRGRIGPFAPAGSFEAKTTSEGSKATLYVRFVGGAS